MTIRSTDSLEKRLERSLPKSKKDGTRAEKRSALKLVKRLQRKIARTKAAYKNAGRSRKSTTEASE